MIRNRKYAIILVLAVLLTIVVILSNYKKMQKTSDETSTYSEKYPNQIYLNAEECGKFIVQHKETLNSLLAQIKIHVDKYGFCSVNYDENGILHVSSVLASNESFSSALQDIYSDEIFRTNLFAISAGDTNVEFYLYCNEQNYTRSGIIYYWDEIESCNEPWEEQIDEHWIWYDYPMI